MEIELNIKDNGNYSGHCESGTTITFYRETDEYNTPLEHNWKWVLNKGNTKVFSNSSHYDIYSTAADLEGYAQSKHNKYIEIVI